MARALKETRCDSVRGGKKRILWEIKTAKKNLKHQRDLLGIALRSVKKWEKRLEEFNAPKN
jgi:hypothetical protein